MPSIRPLGAHYAPSMRHLCAHYAPSMRPLCALYAPFQMDQSTHGISGERKCTPFCQMDYFYLNILPCPSTTLKRKHNAPWTSCARQAHSDIIHPPTGQTHTQTSNCVRAIFGSGLPHGSGAYHSNGQQAISAQRGTIPIPKNEKHACIVCRQPHPMDPISLLWLIAQCKTSSAGVHTCMAGTSSVTCC